MAMKTIQQLRKLFVYIVAALLFIFLASHAKANDSALSWKVFVLFLGGDMPSSFQKDIDRNIIELSRVLPDENLKLKVVREYQDQWVSYEPNNQIESNWDDLFFKPPIKNLKIPGQVKNHNLNFNSRFNSRIWSDPEFKDEMKSFFLPAQSVQSTEHEHTMLIIYSHGQAAAGLSSISIAKLSEFLKDVMIHNENKNDGDNSSLSNSSSESLQPLDILWMNSCFMANVEAAYQLRNISKYYLASEDAEFSSGMPFQNLEELKNKNSLDASKLLGLKYIESYKHLPIKYPATLSLIDQNKWGPFIFQIKQFSKLKLTKQLKQMMEMKDKNWIDVGDLAKNLGLTSENQESYSQVLNQLILFSYQTKTLVNVAQNHYIGLNIFNPEKPIPFINYLDLQFVRETNWAMGIR